MWYMYLEILQDTKFYYLHVWLYDFNIIMYGILL